MRTSHLALGLTVAAIAAAGCGSSSKSNSATSPAAPSTPVTPTTSSTATTATAGGFCAQFKKLSHHFATESGKGRNQDVTLNAQLLAEYKALKPPAAAQASYTEFVTAFSKLTQDLKGNDRAAFQQDAKAAVTAAQKVGLQANCK